MPDLGSELHDGRFERVFIGDIDGNFVCSTLIWSTSRTSERAAEIRDAVTNGFCKDLRSRISSDVGQIFGYPSCFVASHCLLGTVKGIGVKWEDGIVG